MKLSKIKLYFHTIRYLKWIQVRYQIWYRVRSKWRHYFKYKYPLSLPSHPVSLNFIDWIDKPETLSGDTFRFLNLSYQFENPEINWSFVGFGKLWNYNLNYMDFLLQPEMGAERGVMLIKLFVQDLSGKSSGLEPYPISLRGMNWIKFLTKHAIQIPEIDDSLFAHYKILPDNLEYHLLGNHLLENGFSLLFGAFYFREKEFYLKAKTIISSELNEQVLDDGAHFELSPMYHQIVLDRLLDCINLVQNNQRFEDQPELLELMKAKASLMLKWMNAIIFMNGEIPMMNDSARGIAPTAHELNEYAVKLEISGPDIEEKHLLTASGFLCIREDNYECVADTGHIGASYQPGHGHADTFNFELYLNGHPLVVDTGVSTYEKNSRRQIERSTASHNTVEIAGRNSSQVWGGFRVGARAEVISSEKTPSGLKVSHNGYRKLGIIHEREFSHDAVSFSVCDRLLGKKDLPAISRFHFHPGIDLKIEGNTITFPGGHLRFDNIADLRINDYLYAPEFNILIPGKVIEANFSDSMKAVFQFSR